jgi:hypothetical protein
MPAKRPAATIECMGTTSTNSSDRPKARAGDRLVIQGHREGAPQRDAQILEVRGPGGAPPYLVRWQDDGHESIYYPGSDASVQHLEHGGRGRSS